MEYAEAATFKDFKHLVSVQTEKDEKYFQATLHGVFTPIIANELGYFQVGNILYQDNGTEVIEFDAISKVEKKRTKSTYNEKDLDARACFPLDREFAASGCDGLRKLRGKMYIDNVPGVYSETGAWLEYTRKNALGYWVLNGATANTLKLAGQIVEYRSLVGGGICSVTGFYVTKQEVQTNRIIQPANYCYGCCANVSIGGGVFFEGWKNCPAPNNYISFTSGCE